MVEVVITGGIIAAGAIVMARRQPNPVGSAANADLGLDLPCPWCRADTAETDDSCPGCGQAFG